MCTDDSFGQNGSNFPNEDTPIKHRRPKKSLRPPTVHSFPPQVEYKLWSQFPTFILTTNNAMLTLSPPLSHSPKNSNLFCPTQPHKTCHILPAQSSFSSLLQQFPHYVLNAYLHNRKTTTNPQPTLLLDNREKKNIPHLHDILLLRSTTTKCSLPPSNTS